MKMSFVQKKVFIFGIFGLMPMLNYIAYASLLFFCISRGNQAQVPLGFLLTLSLALALADFGFRQFNSLHFDKFGQLPSVDGSNSPNLFAIQIMDWLKTKSAFMRRMNYRLGYVVLFIKKFALRGIRFCHFGLSRIGQYRFDRSWTSQDDGSRLALPHWLSSPAELKLRRNFSGVVGILGAGWLQMGFGVFLLGLMLGCQPQSHMTYQGYLEADRVRVSPQASGLVRVLAVKEGDWVTANQLIAQIDPDKLHVRRAQAVNQAAGCDHQIEALNAQLTQMQLQLDFQERLDFKTDKLLNAGAVSTQNSDEVKTNRDMMVAKLKEVRARLDALMCDKQQLMANIALLDLQIKDTEIRAPISGRVLVKYAEAGETVAVGMPIVELADTKHLTAKIYAPLRSLNQIVLGQEGTLTVEGGQQDFDCTVSWISSESEFTPKTIMTKETQTSLVYAVKLMVANPNGILKIGMPVSVSF